jgi:HlyD family secretion protein
MTPTTTPTTPARTSFFRKLWSQIKGGGGRVRIYAFKHKIISGIIVLVILGGGYYAYTAIAAGNTATQYVLATVTKAPLMVTVTESGQVDSKDTLSVTPQGGASGQITYVGVTPGQSVKAGAVIARIDDTTAAEAVTSARQDLESAQISYQQTLSSTATSNTDDATGLTTAQTNEAAAITTTFTNLAPVMQGLDSTLHNISTIPDYSAQENINAYEHLVPTAESQADLAEVVAADNTAVSSYQTALAAYQAAGDDTGLTAEQTKQLAQTTIQATDDIAQALSDSLNYYNYISNQLSASKSTLSTQLPTQISNLTSYQSTTSGDESSVTSANTSLVNAELALSSDTQTLGGDTTVPLNVQSAQLSVAKAQEALTQAETTDADYDIVAPFSGTIATVPVNQYDQASSGTTIATLITDQDYVDISLNETDAASVMLGQPVTMTFTAIPNLTLTGKVAEIDPVGTVTSGVVTYDVQISFDNEDARVKPGMTVTAVITTASVASAIQVPSSAITTNNGISTVQVATLTNASSTLAAAGGGTGTSTGARRTRTASSTSAYSGGGFGGGAGGFGSTTGALGAGGVGTTSTTTAALAVRFAGLAARTLTVPETSVTIKRVPVTLGLSTDTMTQITTGLQPGQYVVSSTISKAAATKTAAASATSLLGGGAAGRGGFTGGAGGAGGGFTRGAAAGGGGAAVGAAGRGG